MVAAGSGGRGGRGVKFLVYLHLWGFDLGGSYIISMYGISAVVTQMSFLWEGQYCLNNIYTQGNFKHAYTSKHVPCTNIRWMVYFMHKKQ